MTQVLLFAGLLAVVAAAGWAIRRSGNRAVVRRRLAEVPLVRVADIAGQPAVRVEGMVAPGVETVIAPLSGRRCVLYEIIVEEMDRRGFDTWKTLADERRGRAFWLDDGTGRAEVRLGGQIELHLGFDTHETVDQVATPTPRMIELLRRLGKEDRIELVRGGSGRSLRVREAALEPTAWVRVAAAPRRTEHGNLLESSPERPLVLSDDR